MNAMSAMTDDAVPELTLGWRLQMAMRHAGLTALDMAQELEVGRDTVARWIHDDTVPHRLFLQAWATRCGVNYDWLVGQEPPKVARGTSESPGRRAVTDNKDSRDSGRRPRRKRAETHSYRQERRYCAHGLFGKRNMQTGLDEYGQRLLDHSAWVALRARRRGND